jgi:hypothetical protein
MWSRKVVCCRLDELRTCAATRSPRWKISTVRAVIRTQTFSRSSVCGAE